MTKPADDKTTPTDTATGRRPRRKRVHRATLATLIGLAIGVLLVTRSGLLKFVILPQIQSLVACDATCGRVVLDSSGQLNIYDLTMSAPGIDGPAARFLYAPKVRIELALDSWWPGSLRVSGIHLTDPVVRISQAEDLSLNVGALLLPRATTGMRIPEVGLEGTLELGEHGNGNYIPIVSLQVQGGIEADPDSRGLYNIDLIGDPQSVHTEMLAENLGSPTHLQGYIDLGRGAFTLQADNINLTALSARSAPRSFRGYWEELSLRGLIPSSTVSYEPDRGLSASFDLVGVNLSIPVPVTNEEDILSDQPQVVRDEDALDMHDVSGEISFDRRGLSASLRGRVEDFTCFVSLQTQGLSIDAPLTCRIETDEFAIVKGDDPRLLPFAPAFAQKVFRKFTSPGATLEGQVVLRRVASDSGDGTEWFYEGAFDLHDGEARYEQFPYPFESIEATFIFDQDKFEMPRISGVGRGTSAKFLASGIIEPPTPAAEVNVDVTLVDMPMDDVFKRSLPESARGVYGVLFSDAAYEQSVLAGRILDRTTAEEKRLREREILRNMRALEASDDPASPDEIADLDAQLTQVRQDLTAPEFELGGLARVNLLIHRPAGLGQRFTFDIDFRVPTAGVMPSAFPYPATATDVAIRMNEGLAEITSFPLQGLTGATGTLSGRVEYELAPGGAFSPLIRLQAEGVPIDAFLIEALPDETGGEGPGPLPRTPRAMMRALNIDGAVSRDARIENHPSGEVGFTVDVGVEHATATPSPDLRLDDVTGKLIVSNEALEIDRIRGLLGGQPFTLELMARFDVGEGGGGGGGGGEGEPPLTGAFEVQGLDLDQPVESILDIGAPEEARILASLREKHNPAGRLDVRLSFARFGQAMDYRVETEHLEGIAFDAFGTRIHLDEVDGIAAISQDAIEFQKLRMSVTPEGVAEPTRVDLDGKSARKAGIDGELRIGVRDGRFESPVALAVARATGDVAAAAIADWEPTGRFDLTASRRTFADGSPPQIAWALEPDSLAVHRGESTVAFTGIEGRIAYDEQGGRAESLRLESDSWSATVEGTWELDPGARADFAVTLEAESVSEDLIATMPSDIAEVLRAIEVDVTERVALTEGRVTYRADAPEGETRTAFDGEVEFAGLSAKPGVSITEAEGGASVRYRRVQGAPGSEFGVDLFSERFRILGVELTDASARLEQGEHPDARLLRSFRARTNGGRVTGRAVFSDAQRMGLGVPGRSYEVHAEVTGVGFGSLLAQLGSPEGEPAEPIDRGVLDASFSVFGAFSDDRTRRGRGTVRVEGGDVLNMPGILPLLELSNLQAPAGEKVDLGYVDFFVGDDRVIFEDIYLYSPSIRITGEGEMAWPSTELDLSVETRGMRQIPILSDILTSLREEIVSTRVSGTLYDPEFRYEQLSGARRLFGTMLGGGTDERQGR